MVTEKQYDDLMGVLLEDIYLTVEEMVLSFEQMCIEFQEEMEEIGKEYTLEEVEEIIISIHNGKIPNLGKKAREVGKSYGKQFENLLNITAYSYYIAMLENLSKLYKENEPTEMAGKFKKIVDSIVENLKIYNFKKASYLFEEMYDDLSL